MRNFILFIVIIIATCAMPPMSPAQEPNVSNNYSTMWLMQWLHNCSHALAPSYQMRGMSEQFAMQKSITDCACVIDKFRTNFSQTEADNMTVKDRQLFSERFTQQCLGFVSGT